MWSCSISGKGGATWEQLCWGLVAFLFYNVRRIMWEYKVRVWGSVKEEVLGQEIWLFFRRGKPSLCMFCIWCTQKKSFAHKMIFYRRELFLFRYSRNRPWNPPSATEASGDCGYSELLKHKALTIWGRTDTCCLQKGCVGIASLDVFCCFLKYPHIFQTFFTEYWILKMLVGAELCSKSCVLSTSVP